MSETPENLDPKEATEAKLCAYLEGETTPAERTEIEKYLQSNPQHRKLLSDLAATRSLLRQIPKESAPPEIAEAFEGQLERSMLLDEMKPTVGGKNARWPQLLFAAAMVALATGLGVVIYYTLPTPASPKYSVATTVRKSDQLSQFKMPTSTPASPNVNVDNTVAAAMNEKAKLEDGLGVEAAGARSTAQEGQTFAAKTQAGTGLVNAAPTPSPIVAVAPPALDAGKSSQLPNALNDHRELYFGNNSKAPTRYIVLSTDNPADSARDVEASLNSNHVIFETHAPTTQFAMQYRDKDVTALGGSLMRNRQSFASGPATQPAPLPVNESKELIDRNDQTVYIARAISPKQADSITNDLSVRQKPGLSVQSYVAPATQPVIDHPLAATMPTTAPAEAVATDDSLTITVAELVGPGVDKTNTVKVADDGSITLPMIEPIHALGLSTRELEKQIATKYRDANLIPAATVQVKHSTLPSATQPTTMASIAATQPAEQLDQQVVIVIQKNAEPPATQPTTQP